VSVRLTLGGGQLHSHPTSIGAVWGFELGGYPVLKKWLGYRQESRRGGRPLTLTEARYFRSMIQRLAALSRYSKSWMPYTRPSRARRSPQRILAFEPDLAGGLHGAHGVERGTARHAGEAGPTARGATERIHAVSTCSRLSRVVDTWAASVEQLVTEPR
jgi:hypothetical protein